MDNEQEVKTIDELREFFSAEKVIEYLKDGQLVTWLNDRYLNDIAEKVSTIDANDQNAENLLRKALGMEYEEAEEVSEEAPEELVIRSRKMGKLKEYTNEKRYFDVIDNMAFDQDELYDLLDEGKHEIYLCGDRFYIPLSVKNMTYYGVNEPIAIIDSKEKVDFGSKDISFENIRFDEHYCSIIGLDYDTAQHEELSETNDDDGGDLAEFSADLARFVNSFKSDRLDFDFQDLCYDYEDIDEPDPCDYNSNEYDYYMKSEVQSACKEALGDVVNDLKSYFDDLADELKTDSLEKLDDIPGLLHNFADDFSDAYFEYAEDYDFDNETTAYIKSCYEKCFTNSVLDSKINSYKIEEKAEELFDKSFGDKNIGLDKSKKYRDMCDYDKEDDTYCYDISDAVESMTNDVNAYIGISSIEFKGKVEEFCESVKNDFADYLLSKINAEVNKK